jgi:exonuclease III
LGFGTLRGHVKVNNYYVNKLRDEEFIKYTLNHDILCIQETHCGPNDIPSRHLTDFASIPHCRKKSNNNRFFGGMMLLVRKSIRKGIKVTDTEDPEILGITLKKDFFNLPKNLYVWFTYAPPVNSPYAKNREKSSILRLEEKIAYKNPNNHLVMGDLNGRTSDTHDFIQEENDCHSPLQDIDHYTPDIPLSRQNSDTNPVDTNGKLILNLCKTLQMRILNGRTPGDRWGAPTRFPLHKAEKPSLIDYAICTSTLMHRVESLFVLPSTTLSDHCCISTRISCKYSDEAKDSVPQGNNLLTPTVGPGFQLSKIGTYQTNLHQDPAFDALLGTIKAKLRDKSQTITQADVDEWTQHFTSNIHDNAAKSFANKQPPKSSAMKKQPQHQKPARWFNDHCTKAKNQLKRTLSHLKKDPYNRGNQERAVAARKEYKKTCKEAESHNRKVLLDQLLNSDDPKEFWRRMKNMQGYGRETEDPSSCITQYLGRLLQEIVKLRRKTH